MNVKFFYDEAIITMGQKILLGLGYDLTIFLMSGNSFSIKLLHLR